SPVITSQRKQIADLAVRSRLLAIHFDTEYVEVGGLVTYGVNIPDLFRRAATYVDKILKGAKPAHLPVEQPTKVEIIINLKTANKSGLKIPPNVLERADKVIKGKRGASEECRAERQGKNMKEKITLLPIWAILFALSLPAVAQQTGKIS